MYKNVDLSQILYDFNVENFDLHKIKEKNSKKTRVVYKIESNNLFFCLKQTYFNENELLFIYSYLEWLRLYNIKVPYLIKSKQKKPFVNENNKIYILTNWIHGDKLNYDDLDQCILSINFLSKMHNISKNIPFIKDSFQKIAFINLRQRYSKNIFSMNKIFENAKSTNDNFSKIFLDYFKNFNILANFSNRIARIINFKNLNISMCHGDFVNKNIIINKNEIIPIDFDKACINYSIYDLSYFLRRYLKRNNTKWNFDYAKTLINYYSKNNPLFLDEYLYLLSYLSFPQKFFKIGKFYFSNIKNLSKKQKNIQEYLLNKICSSFFAQFQFSILLKEHIDSIFKIF